MGGEGPYLKFSPGDDYDLAFWAKHTGLSSLGDDLEAAYVRGAQFLNEKKMELVKDHGWNELPGDDINLFALTSPRPGGGQLRLPLSFASFLDPEKLETWNRMFRIFDARRHNRNDNTLFIDGPKSMSDIVYLLQSLAPGMLLIVRMDEIDEVGESTTSRALPSDKWVEDHKEVLEHVLGSKERYEKLLAAATGHSTSFHDHLEPIYFNPEADDSDYYTDMWGVREPLDYTACSSECGYCGRCDYGDEF